MIHIRISTFFLTLAVSCSAVVAGTAPSPYINYEGVLRDASGAPLSGTFNMTFGFFDTTGNEILIDAHSAVTVTGGLFNVQLGTGAVTDGSGAGTYRSLPEAFRDFEPVFLEVTIGSETLSPRVRVTSTASALNAQFVKGLDLVANAPLDLYVDTSGDNGNDCLSLSTACATIQAAIDRIPLVLGGHVTIHIASGTYPGGLILTDRLSPRGLFHVKLQGEPSATIQGGGSIGAGLLVSGVPQVFLENLTITNSDSVGLWVRDTLASLTSCEISYNVHDGIQSMLADVDVRNTTIHENGENGIQCAWGWVDIGESQPLGEEVNIANNQVGIEAQMGCRVEFKGHAVIEQNKSYGCLARGGTINFKDRNDVELRLNDPPFYVHLHSIERGIVRNYYSALFSPMDFQCTESPELHGICYVH